MLSFAQQIQALIRAVKTTEDTQRHIDAQRTQTTQELLAIENQKRLAAYLRKVRRPQVVMEISDGLGVNKSTVRKHLRAMRQDGRVDMVRCGNAQAFFLKSNAKLTGEGGRSPTESSPQSGRG